MEYVIGLVGLSAVFAAWDAARRAIESTNAGHAQEDKLKEMAAKMVVFESNVIATRSQLAELKNFINATRKR